MLRRHASAVSGGVRSGALLLQVAVIAGWALLLVRDSSSIPSWLGAAQPLADLPTMARQWANSLGYLFVRGPGNSELWLPHIPLLDIFTAALCLIGAYTYCKHGRNVRARMLLAYTLVGSLLVAVGGPAAIGYLVPVAYLLAATGITYLLHLWFVVFPHNPVARYLGNALLYGAALLAVWFSLLAYFVAWRSSPTTLSLHSPTRPAYQDLLYWNRQ